MERRKVDIFQYYFAQVLVIILVLDCATAHVRLTYPLGRQYDLDFLDNIRTPLPCGMPASECHFYFPFEFVSFHATLLHQSGSGLRECGNHSEWVCCTRQGMNACRRWCHAQTLSNTGMFHVKMVTLDNCTGKNCPTCAFPCRECVISLAHVQMAFWKTGLHDSGHGMHLTCTSTS